ncbi:MAG: hypothetical protein IPK60_18610 [Sandaracinaceae bacterium]|nr:hypothetical protein [Sandaracinaceae bacterium]
MDSRDDFGNNVDEALPVTVLSSTGTYLQWGSSNFDYPSLESTSDRDYFLFRGNAGSSYTISANPVGSSAADLLIQVFDLQTLGFFVTGSNPAGPTASLTTGVLPTTGWYAVRIGNRVLSTGEYTARIKLASSADDDFLNIKDEAYPVPNGISQAGYLTGYDVDRFQIYERLIGATNFTVTATGTPLPIVEAFTPAGTSLGSGVGSVVIPSAAITTTGTYYFTVRNPGGTSYPYSVTATFGCATTWNALVCDDLRYAPAIGSRYAWGDRFAGRLPGVDSRAVYSISLAANESATFAVADNTSTCTYALDLLPPAALSYFGIDPLITTPPNTPNPVYQWTDSLDTGFGPGASNQAGSNRGAGGHIFAPVAGTYSVRVRSITGTNCSYRVFLSKAGHLTYSLPEW